MRRNDEDRLIELAYGELSPQEAEQLRASAENDPRLAATLRSYCEMREGLSALKEVPEMQLSCDRLRDAILAGGLKEPRFQGWSWLAAPALVAAAFGITLLVRRPATVLPLGTSIAQVDTKSAPVELSPEVGSFNATSPLGTIEFKEAQATKPVTIQKPRAPRTTVVSTAGPKTTLGVEKSEAAKLDAASPAKIMSGSAEAPSMAMDKGTAPEMQTAALIIIESERNGETGALNATERETASNVVIGG